MYRIIIADDEPLIIRGLKKMMEWGKMDTEVVGEAEDGEQLLNLLDTLEPDIIISDISMPEKTGLDVLKEINKRKLKTKVIFLSGFQEFSYAKEAVTYGAVGLSSEACFCRRTGKCNQQGKGSDCSGTARGSLED